MNSRPEPTIPVTSVIIATPQPIMPRTSVIAVRSSTGLDRVLTIGLNETRIVNNRKELLMAVWNCEKCGYEKEGRCKPKKCPECNDQTVFVKQEQ